MPRSICSYISRVSPSGTVLSLPFVPVVFFHFSCTYFTVPALLSLTSTLYQYTTHIDGDPILLQTLDPWVKSCIKLSRCNGARTDHDWKRKTFYSSILESARIFNGITDFFKDKFIELANTNTNVGLQSGLPQVQVCSQAWVLLINLSRCNVVGGRACPELNPIPSPVLDPSGLPGEQACLLMTYSRELPRLGLCREPSCPASPSNKTCSQHPHSLTRRSLSSGHI